MKRAFLIGATATLMLWASSAYARPHHRTARRTRSHRATDRARSCKLSYHKALRAKRDGDLFEAKALMRRCAVPSCGEFLEHQCTAMYSRIGDDIPSVVPSVTDDAGDPIVRVSVWLDDVLLTDRIDGMAFEVEPGLHELAFEAKGHGVFARRKIVAHQGERNRLIKVRLRRPGQPEHRRAPETRAAVAPDEPAPRHRVRRDLVSRPDAPKTVLERRSRLPGYLLVGLGVAGAAGFGVLTYWGRQDNAALSACSPNCPRASFEHVRKLYISANISLGVGGVALASGAYLLWRAWSPYRVDVAPTRGGGIASIRGEF